MIIDRFPGLAGLLACVALALGVSSAAGAYELTIPGTGATQKMMRELAGAFATDNPACPTTVPESVGSRGGIRAVAKAKAEMARVSRPLKKKERAKGLEFVHYADSRVVFVVHPSVTGVERLTSKQVLDIYAGRITRWSEVGGPDSPIFPLTRDGGTTLRTVKKHIEGFEDTPAAAKLTYSSLETLQLLLGREFTMGYVPETLTVGTSLEVVEVESLSMPLPLGIVHAGAPTGCAAKFLEFLASDTSSRIIESNASTPVAR